LCKRLHKLMAHMNKLSGQMYFPLGYFRAEWNTALFDTPEMRSFLGTSLGKDLHHLQTPTRRLSSAELLHHGPQPMARCMSRMGYLPHKTGA
jgi:hypothetical protein